MSIFGFIVLTLIILFGATFIYVTSKINSLEIASRDRGAEIDSTIWDRTFRLSKMIEILREKGIENDIDVPDTNAFGLGTSAFIQSTRAEQLDTAERKLRRIIKEHPELMNDEAFNINLNKFDTARKELFSYSLAYNKCTSAYNSYISVFPASALATLNKKSDRQMFSYVFADIKED